MKKEMLEKVFQAHKNLIIEGDVASGKTTNVVFPIIDNIIANKESLFILDSKEEYINKYYEKLKENNYNIVILNLRDLEKSEGWNPLEYPYNLYKKGDVDKAQEYLEKIGKMLFYEEENQDPFWTLTTSDLFIGMVLDLFEEAKANEVNFISINAMLDGINNVAFGIDDLTEYFKAKDNSSKSYVFASATLLAPKETKESIASIARQNLRLYLSREKLTRLMNKTTFNFEDLANKPSAIILIARDENKALNALATMFIEQIYAVLVDLKTKNKFNLVLDNFDIIEKCNDLVEILDSCLPRNMRTYIVTRSLSELSNKYGSYMLKLCDTLSISNQDIKININNEEETLAKDFEEVSITEGNIDYPKLKNETIGVFDFQKAVTDVRKKRYADGEYNKLETEFDVNEIMKRLEDKIKKLEEQEEDSK